MATLHGLKLVGPLIPQAWASMLSIMLLTSKFIPRAALLKGTLSLLLSPVPPSSVAGLALLAAQINRVLLVPSIVMSPVPTMFLQLLEVKLI